MVATPFSAVISDNFGRRKCMFAGGWVIIIGSIVIATASTLAHFIVGRFILGFGIQIMVVSAPAYAAEISPPHWRGRAVGTSQNFGYKDPILICPIQACITAAGSVALSPPRA